MVDTVPPEVRSRMMKAIPGKDTKPERFVRSMLFALGYRYRLHRKDLPGKPDLVFPGRKKVIFVHGCFWHSHENCPESSVPKSNTDYWVPKLKKNKERDERHQADLAALGWTVKVVWECELSNPEKVANELIGFLENRT